MMVRQCSNEETPAVDQQCPWQRVDDRGQSSEICYTYEYIVSIYGLFIREYSRFKLATGKADTYEHK